MKRWRTTLIVAGVFLALLLYVVLVERQREPPAAPGAPGSLSAPSPTPASVVDIAGEDVRALHVAAGDRSLSLVRQDGGWAIPLKVADPRQGGISDAVPSTGAAVGVSSEAAPADTSIYWSIEEILQLDARLIVVEGATDLAQYGLDVPVMTVVIERTGGTAEQLLVGRRTPDGTAFYLQHTGDPRLYIVDHYKIQTLYDWLADPPYQPTPTP